MHIILLKGIPGSGKSTFAKKFVDENPNYVRINKDDLRRMRGKYWIPAQEKIIGDWEIALCYYVARHGFDILIDGTNMNTKTIDDILRSICKGFVDRCRVEAWKHLKSFRIRAAIKAFWNNDIVVEDKWMDTPVEECIRRDSLRPEPVGEKVIRDFHKRYLKQRKHDLVQ